MAQETFVGRVDPGKVRDMAQQFEAQGMVARDVMNAIFSYTGSGLTATLYRSGKIVIQGQSAEEFGRRLLGEPAKKTVEKEEDLIGTDESGKGDYFGPLVVAAVYANPQQRAEMRMGEIDDSKNLSDTTIKRLAGAIQEKLAYSVVALDPEEYNRRYQKFGNLNKLLASLHAEAILQLAGKVPGRRVLSDQFGDESLIRLALGEKFKDFQLSQRPRAEEDPSVAAASILARNEFVRRMRALSEQFAVDLPLGANEEVEKAAKRVIQIHGRENLGKVAKLHFKTTQKIDGLF